MSEYHDAMMKMMELIWGPGFMAPGGEGNVAKQVDGLAIRGKRVLDIGSGLGGPAFVLAETYGASVVGIDLEPHLVQLATQRSREKRLEARTEFMTVEPGRLPFPDQSFDVVLSCGALTQIEDKETMFRDCLRVLRPGGALTCYDWMKSEGEYSEEMRYWFKMEGLTYNMESPARYEQMLEAAGFVDIAIVDRSDWYRRRVRTEYEMITTDLNKRMVEILGQRDADHFVENWRAMVVVCDKGEMLQVYSRAHKPLEPE